MVGCGLGEMAQILQFLSALCSCRVSIVLTLLVNLETATGRVLLQIAVTGKALARAGGSVRTDLTTASSRLG